MSTSYERERPEMQSMGFLSLVETGPEPEAAMPRGLEIQLPAQWEGRQWAKRRAAPNRRYARIGRGVQGEIRMIDLKAKAEQIRGEVMRVAIRNKAGHIAPSLSCVDILVSLFYDVMGPDDHFILSKAHGGYALYAILADKGILPRERWENFDLPGCVERMPQFGIEAGCGSLGHGLPMAVGLAFALALQKKPGRVFVLVGDGELQEGTTWEALNFARRHKLTNLGIFVDGNGLQAMDRTANVMGILPIAVFGDMLCWVPTVKGSGMPCAEGKIHFHYRSPGCAEL